MQIKKTFHPRKGTKVFSALPPNLMPRFNRCIHFIVCRKDRWCNSFDLLPELSPTAQSLSAAHNQTTFSSFNNFYRISNFFKSYHVFFTSQASLLFWPHFIHCSDIKKRNKKTSSRNQPIPLEVLMAMRWLVQ